MSDNVEKWVTVKEVMEYLGVGRDTVLQAISKKGLPAYKVGRLWKLKLSEVDEWVKSDKANDDVPANESKKTSEVK